MALINPFGPAFAHWTDNFGTPGTGASAATDGYGVAMTAGTSSADGSVTEIVPALAHDCEYLWLGIQGFAISGSASSALLDIMIDPAGGTSWSELISDLVVGGASAMSWALVSTSVALGLPLGFHFPLWIRAGASIGARARFAGASAPTNSRVMAIVAGGNKNPASWWCGQKVETVGTLDAANSRGQVVSPGGSGAFGSWTNLGSTTGARAGAAQWAVGCPPTNTAGENSFLWEFGYGSTRLGPRLMKGTTTGERQSGPMAMPFFCDIPAGTQIQVRGMCGSALASPATDMDCAAYLVS